MISSDISYDNELFAYVDTEIQNNDILKPKGVPIPQNKCGIVRVFKANGMEPLHSIEIKTLSHCVVEQLSDIRYHNCFVNAPILC